MGKGGFSPHSCDAERRSLGWATRTGILSLYSHFRAMSPPLGEIMPLHERYGVGFPSVGWTDTGDRLRQRFGAPEHPYKGVRRGEFLGQELGCTGVLGLRQTLCKITLWVLAF